MWRMAISLFLTAMCCGALIQASPGTNSSALQRLAVLARCVTRCYVHTQLAHTSKHTEPLDSQDELAGPLGNFCTTDECTQCMSGVGFAASGTCSASCISEICVKSCSCVEEIASVPDALEESRMVVAGKVGAPVLHCRSSSDRDSLLYVKWTGPELPLVYIVELMLKGAAASPWMPVHNTVERMVALLGLLPEAQYKVRVRAVAADGQVGQPVESGWITTPPANRDPEPVTNVTVVMEDVRVSKVNARVTWTPASDMQCMYQVAAFPSEGSSYIFKELEGVFGTMLSLEYDNSYNVTVRAQDKERQCESKMAWAHFHSPSCLQAHNFNLSVCLPEAPMINVTEEEVTDPTGSQELYDVLVSWSEPVVDPDYYTVTVTVRKPKEIVYNVNTTGNVTNARVRAIALGNRYSVVLRACSPTGCSASNIVLRESEGLFQVRKGVRANLQEENNADYISNEGVVWGSVISSSLLLVVLLSGGVWLYRRHVRTRTSHLSVVYPEDIEKEVDYKCASQAQADEWEIPRSCIVLGIKLGEGAFGVVHRGLLKVSKEPEGWSEVAVKSLKSNAEAEDTAAFLHEINVMKCVGRHPNIVSLIGCCTQAAQLQLVVEYCCYGDLQMYLRSAWQQISAPDQPQSCDSATPLNYVSVCNNSVSSAAAETVCVFNAVENTMYMDGVGAPDAVEVAQEPAQPTPRSLTATRLLSFARQISIGMEYLSGNRVIHRDLAARNVLVCEGETVKISDFGLSRDVYEQNMYQKKGKGRLPIKWMALESLVHQIYTTQSDVWSFGVLLWEIVTLGGNPYPTTPSSQLFKLLKAGYRMECPTSCNPDLYQVMVDCWKARPKDRPTFTELSQRLDKLLEASSSHEYLSLDKINDNYHFSSSGSSC